MVINKEQSANEYCDKYTKTDTNTVRGRRQRQIASTRKYSTFS